MVMNMTCVTPRDAMYRHFMMQPEIARELFECHFPEEVKDLCDFTTLQLEPQTFTEDKARQHFRDVFYSLSMVSGDVCYVHVVITHQPAPDKHIAFRMLKYAVAAMQQHLDAGYEHLPLVIPLLITTGTCRSRLSPRRWLDDFSDPSLAEKLYSKPFPLIDLSMTKDDEIGVHNGLAALNLLHHRSHRTDSMYLIERLDTVLQEKRMSPSLITVLMNYLIQTGETPDAEAFVRELAHRVPHHQETLLNIAKQFELSGYEKAVEKGIAEGERLAMLKIARRMLENGLDRSSVKSMTGLSEEDLLQNLTWR
ncbi:Rpn family recombination-promoting nuclease/putative transposase [Pantoea endophytica]|uniref:Rpn family recombination-promoting nuclease/putative transposase n=1 Tax=Pantoea sp. BJ2 TaxID=3141322 RepID=A0AAU7U4N6_9GAMM